MRAGRGGLVIAPRDLQVEVLLAVGAHRDVATDDQREIVGARATRAARRRRLAAELLGEHARLDRRQRLGRVGGAACGAHLDRLELPERPAVVHGAIAIVVEVGDGLDDRRRRADARRRRDSPARPGTSWLDREVVAAAQREGLADRTGSSTVSRSARASLTVRRPERSIREHDRIAEHADVLRRRASRPRRCALAVAGCVT